MNWFTLAGAILHILKNVPDLVDDIEDFVDKIRGKEPPPEDANNAINAAINAARQG